MQKILRYPAFYLLLSFGGLVALVLSLLPVAPALSNNIPACLNPPGVPVAARVAIAGHPVTPTLLFRAATPSQPCAVSDSNLSLVSLLKTIIVSPSANNDPNLNGATLLTAMTFISNALPSASNPYLLKVEPGSYYIAAPLILLPFVDLEGSGEGTTTISSTVGTSGNIITGTLIAASNSEARSINIANTGTSLNQAAVYVPANVTNTRFQHLTASGTGTSGGNVAGNGYGLYNAGGTFTLADSTLFASGGVYNSGLFIGGGKGTVTGSNLSASGGTANNGLRNTSTATVTVTGSSLSASSTGTSSNYALNNDGTATVTSSTLAGSGGGNTNAIVNFGTVSVDGSALSASGGTGNNTVLLSLGASGSALVTRSNLTATGGNFAYGLNNSNGSTISVVGSNVTVSGGTSNYGIYNSTASTATVTNSSLTASGGTTSYGLSNFSVAKVSNSELTGGTAVSQNLTICPFSINGANFNPLANGSCV